MSLFIPSENWLSGYSPDAPPIPSGYVARQKRKPSSYSMTLPWATQRRMDMLSLSQPAAGASARGTPAARKSIFTR